MLKHILIGIANNFPTTGFLRYCSSLLIMRYFNVRTMGFPVYFYNQIFSYTGKICNISPLRDIVAETETHPIASFAHKTTTGAPLHSCFYEGHEQIFGISQYLCESYAYILLTCFPHLWGRCPLALGGGGAKRHASFALAPPSPFGGTSPINGGSKPSHPRRQVVPSLPSSKIIFSLALNRSRISSLRAQSFSARASARSTINASISESVRSACLCPYHGTILLGLFVGGLGGLLHTEIQPHQLKH